jgi:hypothetical protein
MAEVMGTAASAISIVSLAGQIGSGLQKLHSFWESVADAPSDVDRIMQDLQLLQNLVSAISHGYQRIPPQHGQDSVAAVSLGRCLAQMKKLEAIVEPLSKLCRLGSGRHRFRASLTAALKRDRIAKFSMELESAKVTILLSEQLFSR